MAEEAKERASHRGLSVRGNEEKSSRYLGARYTYFHSSHLSRKRVLREDQPASFVTLNVLQPVLLCRATLHHRSGSYRAAGNRALLFANNSRIMGNSIGTMAGWPWFMAWKSRNGERIVSSSTVPVLSRRWPLNALEIIATLFPSFLFLLFFPDLFPRPSLSSTVLTTAPLSAILTVSISTGCRVRIARSLREPSIVLFSFFSSVLLFLFLFLLFSRGTFTGARFSIVVSRGCFDLFSAGTLPNEGKQFESDENEPVKIFIEVS